MSENEKTLAEELKAQTRDDHEKVDNLVSSLDPFASEENYAKFLRLQEIFHKIVDEIYLNPELNSKIQGLSDLARHAKVKQDMQDLGVSGFEVSSLPKPEGLEAIGWLYCAEGSNLGAAFLLKGAEKMGLSAEHGARHLGAHEDGRGRHWRDFSKIFNQLSEDPASYPEIIEGAKKAFAYYAQLAEKVFAEKN